jgi:hypothetical protein
MNKKPIRVFVLYDGTKVWTNYNCATVAKYNQHKMVLYPTYRNSGGPSIIENQGFLVNPRKTAIFKNIYVCKLCDRPTHEKSQFSRFVSHDCNCYYDEGI